jgi:hypothetical protein
VRGADDIGPHEIPGLFQGALSAAIGPVPVHGARHDAHAFAASGLKDLLAGLPAAADLGYLGVEGIAIVPYRTPPGGHLHAGQADFNKQLSGIRAAAEPARLFRSVFAVWPATWPVNSRTAGAGHLVRHASRRFLLYVHAELPST